VQVLERVALVDNWWCTELLLLLRRPRHDLSDLLGEVVVGQLSVDLVAEEGHVELLRREVASVVTAWWLDNYASGVDRFSVGRQTYAGVVVAPGAEILLGKCLFRDSGRRWFIFVPDFDCPGWVEAHQVLGCSLHVVRRRSESSG